MRQPVPWPQPALPPRTRECEGPRALRPPLARLPGVRRRNGVRALRRRQSDQTDSQRASLQASQCVRRNRGPALLSRSSMLLRELQVVAVLLLAAAVECINPYAVLGLPRSASNAQLSKAYRALARKW